MKAQIVSFHCVLSDKMGRIISSTFNQDVITYGHSDLLKGLAEKLGNLKKGEKRNICLTADQAYGFYDPKLVVIVARQQLSQGPTLIIGDRVLGQSFEGKALLFRVIQVSPETVTLDGNHPLAGQDLVFDIEATEARDASLEEIAESDLEGTIPDVPVPNIH